MACSESGRRSDAELAVVAPAAVALHPRAENPIEALVARGESAYSRGSIDSARAVWRQALRDSRVAGDTNREARILTSLGLAAYRLGDYPEARSLGERALALKLRHDFSEDLFKSYNALGLLAWNEGRLRDAIVQYKHATALARAQHDHASLAKAANNVGLVHVELGDFAQARAGFEEGYRAGLELHDTLIQGRSLSNLGMLDIEIGNPGSAIPRLKRARMLARATGDATGEQNTLGQIGSAYEGIGEPRLALAALDSALTLARRQGLKQEEASNLELIAGLSYEAGRHRQALQLYREANVVNLELGLDVERGTNLRNSAKIQALLGRLDLAMANARAALDIHRTTGARVQVVRDLLVLADLGAGPGAATPAVRSWLAEASQLAGTIDTRSARAEVALASALIAERAGRPHDVLTTLRRARADISAGGYKGESAAAAMMARAYAGLSELDSAVAEGRRAIAAVERVHGNFGSAFLRASFLSDKSAPYADLVSVLLRQGRAAEAFEVADAARSRALVENAAAATSRGNSAAGAAMRDLAEGHTMLRRIDALIALLDQAEETPLAERSAEYRDHIRSLTLELNAARSAYEALVVQVASRDASGSVLLGNSGVSIRELQDKLAPDEAVLEYLLTPERLLVFVVTHTTVEAIARSVKPAELEGRVRIALDLLGKPGTAAEASHEVLARLHATLIGPARDAGLLHNARRLIVVPHGALAYVPFAALRDGRTGRYLVEDYALVHVPSAAALVVLRNRARVSQSRPSSRPTAFAPFLATLPGTGREARAFRRAIPGAQSIVGPGATERRVRAALLRSSIVHLATHGRMNPRNPMFSRIEMVRGSGAAEDDGRLEVHELLGMRIGGGLVFLSGCETGLGLESSQPAAGEDYATLAQAFLYAGAASVAATLWPIADDGAAELAARFYARLEHSAGPEALAAAQRDLIRHPRFRSTYYWAAYFIASGAEPRGGPHTRPRASVLRS